jgi:hypothetical protein
MLLLPIPQDVDRKPGFIGINELCAVAAKPYAIRRFSALLVGHSGVEALRGLARSLDVCGFTEDDGLSIIGVRSASRLSAIGVGARLGGSLR